MASGNKNCVLSALQDVSVEKPGKQDKNGTQINKKINKKEYYSHLALWAASAESKPLHRESLNLGVSLQKDKIMSFSTFQN